ncbi:hypothetical protein [Lacihabitans soyangensis]|uniref:Uncharacterized protein n=1 Tax=Lacihabitans soyangensis TaxID=869394 RepID=A0AAE3KRW6_9BACT|nr:hypothetical protein [Lacihabitans soyangensis]MCP9762518.1 hypothetical protein [Lacihabitans soyangensis]
MELEELKTTWGMYDKKILSTQNITQKLIESMIRERSISRVERLKKQYFSFFALLIVEAGFMLAILFGNPFDFKYQIQFLPFLLLLMGIIVAFINLTRYYEKISKPLIDKNIGTFLNDILDFYEKNQKYEKWFGLILFSIGFLVPLSFLPPKIEKYGILKGLLDTAIPMAISLILYFLAFKMGAFRKRHKENFKSDLEEYNELKEMSGELNEKVS